MEYPIAISNINDFIFCPISVYFSALYADSERKLFQEKRQINGTNAHKAIDERQYSTKKNVLQARDVYCERYGLIGKIDVFDIDTGTLTERKKHIATVYDGYVFQIYAQYFCLTEMGYTVNRLRLYSYDDNRTFEIALPENDEQMLRKFENTLDRFRRFDVLSFVPKDANKCRNCIYRNICDRGLIDD